MASKKGQNKVGIPAKRRGQQMGDSRSNPDPHSEAESSTPALSGGRRNKNKMFGDKSSQEIGSDATGPSSTSPSVPAAIPTDKPLGQSGGEKAFKKAVNRKRGAGY